MALSLLAIPILAVLGIVVPGSIAGGASVSVPATLTGAVKAEGQPVTGSKVTLVAALGASDVTLGAATTSSKGAFSISYAPVPGSTQLMVAASEGTVDQHSVGGARQLLAALGTASTAPSAVVVNELTTVAAVYALHQFLTFNRQGSRVSGSSPGLVNAMATAGNLADPASGKISGVLGNSPNGNASGTLATFNSIAMIIGSCTTGTVTDCGKLFAAVKPPGKIAPRNTVQAIYDLAQYPAARLRPPFALQDARTPRGSKPHYRPILTAPPSAWILTLVYTSGGFDGPGKIGIDAQGNLWSGNNFTPPGTKVGTGVAVVDPTGTPIDGSPIVGGGIAGVGWGTAVDRRGRVWLGNFKGNSVSLLSPAGRVLSPPQGYIQGSVSKPQGVVVDQRGDVWIANFGNASVTEYVGGNPADARSITGGGIFKPFGLAVAANGDLWVTDGAEAGKPGAVTRISSQGTIIGSAITGPGLRSPQGIAIDSSGGVWVSNLLSSSVVRISPSGSLVGSPLRGNGSIRGPWGIAIDGADNVWVANFFGHSLVELCGSKTAFCPPGVRTGQPISPAKTGFASVAMQHLTDVAIDPSGNVWAANNFSTGSPLKDYIGGNGFVELVGQAAPVVTPQIGPPRRP
ncbi:MAG: NHL repeat-containing protein [Acidimicrobiales bacterium]